MSTEEELQEPLLPSDEPEPESPTGEGEVDDGIARDIVFPKCWGDRSAYRINHNVFLNFLLMVIYGIASSMWNGTAFAAYLKKLGKDSNGPFGDIEAVYGLATLVTALPVGYVADRFGRSKVIAAGGMLLMFCTLLQTGIMEWVGYDPDVKKADAALWMLAFINVGWGIGDGVVQGPCAALFADSTPEGERSSYYNDLFVLYNFASSVGPLVSIVLFETLGDDWGIHTLKTVIYVGLGMEVSACVLMLLFDDKKALNESSSEEEEEEAAADETPVVSSTTPPAATPDTLTTLQKRQQWIPYIIFVQDMVAAVGSGMTIKFFPLFFKDEVGMSPSQVQIIFCVAPVALSLVSTLGSKLAGTGFGRVQTQLLFTCLGVSCLYGMVIFKSFLDSHPLMLVPIYVLRTSFMNGSYPLQESILMDFVPKDVRARWKSLDSVAAFGWCGSAALGGWLADRYDYTYTFLITAIMQTCSIGIYALLIPLVPRVEGGEITQGEEAEGAEASTMQEPLLAEDGSP